MLFHIQLINNVTITQDTDNYNTLEEYILHIEEITKNKKMIVLKSNNNTDMAINIDNILYIYEGKNNLNGETNEH